MSATDWTEWNQHRLAEEIAALRARLEAFADGRELSDHSGDATPDRSAPPEFISAIEHVERMFGLSRFERAVVVLCAAVELDGTFGAVCAAATADPARSYPTFGMALAALPGAHWSAAAPGGPLRRTPLIALGEGASITSAPLGIEERVLHYLVGIDAIDQRLSPYLDRVDERLLVDSHDAVASRIATLWNARAGDRAAAVVLTGGDAGAKRSVAARAADSIGASTFAARADALPKDPRDLDAIATLWNREARLSRAVLLLESEGDGSTEHAAAARTLVDRVITPVVISTSSRWPAGRRATVSLEVSRPTAQEQRALWQGTLDGRADVDVDRLVAQFDVGADTIAACVTALPEDAASNGRATRALWESCLRTVSPAMDDLAQRIVPSATWDDLVLPDAHMAQLRDLSRRAHHRWRVYEEWGFGSTGARGRGISALFAGGSGTGKTLAAEVLAGALGVDCYRIDLSQVVSKYIGETEKNLRRVFDAAEDGGAVLLFDEADALFGKRSEVRDSHDRYANIEISFLLQRMESYRGLAILTTNMKEALDHAFTRRLASIVHFPFPDLALRAQIWRRVFPPQTPTDDLDHDALARINVAGGTIRNIALTAAFRAAEEARPVGMSHVIQAARMELGKLDRSFTDLDLEAVR